MGTVGSKQADCVEMQAVLLLLLSLSYTAPVLGTEEEILREDIAEAAEESRALADDLADMLARLSEDQGQVEKTVGDDGNKFDEAMDQLVSRIRELAVVSTKSNELNIPEKVKERELKTTLKEVELVAARIQEVSSINEVDTFEKMANLLNSISENIEKTFGNLNHFDTEDEKVKNLTTNVIEINSIDGMIKTIEKVTDDLRIMNQKNIVEQKIRRLPSHRTFAINY